MMDELAARRDARAPGSSFKPGALSLSDEECQRIIDEAPAVQAAYMRKWAGWKPGHS